jgi:hypothetical protein
MNSNTNKNNDQLIQNMKVEDLKNMIANLQFETFIRDADIFEDEDESDKTDTSELNSADNKN